MGIVVIYLKSNDSLSLLSLDQQQSLKQKSQTLKDPDTTLRIEPVTNGLCSPTSMSFVDNMNLLVLEKNGQVRLISNGVLQNQPLLRVSVNTTAERGLLGNSFGITLDPITGYLWDTENGEANYDEVNLVKPGFNSGWYQVMGPISRSNVIDRDFVNFKESHYADPVFSSYNAIGVTDIEFLKSSKLGEKYTNNIFVGDINNGNLYYLEVNKTRTGLTFDSNTQPGLSDMVADNKDEISEITFGTGFGGITDIKTGPDGFLYILSYGNGSLYRIAPVQQ